MIVYLGAEQVIYRFFFTSLKKIQANAQVLATKSLEKGIFNESYQNLNVKESKPLEMKKKMSDSTALECWARPYVAFDFM